MMGLSAAQSGERGRSCENEARGKGRKDLLGADFVLILSSACKTALGVPSVSKKWRLREV